jgi:hypothetical protein
MLNANVRRIMPARLASLLKLPFSSFAKFNLSWKLLSLFYVHRVALPHRYVHALLDSAKQKDYAYYE